MISHIIQAARQLWWLVVVGLFIGAVLMRISFVGFNAVLGEFLPEVTGIALTVLLIDRIYRFREQKRQEQELKEQLIRDVGSSINTIAVRAVEKMQSKGWLDGPDGVLKGAWLNGSNLKGANFGLANLMGATLSFANLECANLSGTDLRSADLKGAKLDNAILLRTNFYEANLEGVSFKGSIVGSVVLPDGSILSNRGDLKKYTDPPGRSPLERLKELNELADKFYQETESDQSY